ncbi:MAG: hypothetical protein CSA66_00705 [Proteobacteria bacterium]|nr:MAG: hypothetical protein CSA66_00705 [Pseudomonadota bacterium]
MTSSPSDRRLVLLIPLAVVALFGGALALALSSSPRAAERDATARVDREPARLVRPAEAARPVVSVPPAVPPVIDPGPAKGPAASPSGDDAPSGETVPSTDVVKAPWEVVADTKAALAAQAPTRKPAEAIAAAPDAARRRPEGRAHTPAPAPKDEPRGGVEVKPRVEIVESALALGVEGRAPVGVGEVFSTDADKVWAWVKVNNTGAPTFIRMVWRKGDEVAWELKLDVGKSSGWRTWSRKTVRKWDVGQWTVDVFDERGLRVDELDFEIKPAEALRAEAG